MDKHGGNGDHQGRFIPGNGLEQVAGTVLWHEDDTATMYQCEMQYVRQSKDMKKRPNNPDGFRACSAKNEEKPMFYA